LTSRAGAPSPAEDSLRLLQEAQEYARAQNIPRARTLASEAIKANPGLVDGYTRRGFYARVDGDLDAAISDYDRVIEIDPQNSEAWKFRGACKFQKASQTNDRAQATRLLSGAHPDYQRAAQLRPDDEQAGLALLELETCTGKYREAVGTAGVWWKRIQQPNNKVICAWLSGIAFILAGRPDQKWAHFRDFLEEDDTRVGDTEWSVVEINALLRRLPADPGISAERLEKVGTVHRLFLTHFSQGGPRIV
jgi:tetratricopeptide (TPR) repeat protein